MELDNNYDPDDADDAAGQNEVTPTSDDIYSLLGDGRAAEAARRFHGAMGRKDTDSTEVRVAKEVFRWGSAVTGAAAVAAIVL